MPTHPNLVPTQFFTRSIRRKYYRKRNQRSWTDVMYSYSNVLVVLAGIAFISLVLYIKYEEKSVREGSEVASVLESEPEVPIDPTNDGPVNTGHLTFASEHKTQGLSPLLSQQSQAERLEQRHHPHHSLGYVPASEWAHPPSRTHTSPDIDINRYTSPPNVLANSSESVPSLVNKLVEHSPNPRYKKHELFYYH